MPATVPSAYCLKSEPCVSPDPAEVSESLRALLKNPDPPSPTPFFRDILMGMQEDSSERQESQAAPTEAPPPGLPSPLEEQLRVGYVRALLAIMITTSMGFAFWSGTLLREATAPAQARVTGGTPSLTDPNHPSVLQGRAPTGYPVSPKLQSIADMAEYLELDAAEDQ